MLVKEFLDKGWDDLVTSRGGQLGNYKEEFKAPTKLDNLPDLFSDRGAKILVCNMRAQSYFEMLSSINIQETYLSDSQSVEELKSFLSIVLSCKISQFINKPALMCISENIVKEV